MDTSASHRPVIYLRQSQDRDLDRYAVTRQLEDCQKLCAARHLSDPLVIEDNDTSATSRRKRKGWEELLGLVRAGQVRTIVAYAVDRLVRRLADLEALIDLIEQHSVTVITVAGELDLSTPAGRLNARILASVARAEVETKAARQQRSSLQRAQEGRPHIGRRTVGYEHGLTAVREDEAALIREGFSQLLAGASLRSITRDWNSAGFVTTGGKGWTTRGVRMALTNKRYVGTSSYRARSTDAADMAQGQWQPLVTPDVFGAAQVILNDPARTVTNGGRERSHLLAGLAICGKCGLTMGSATRGKARQGERCLKCPTNHLLRSSATIDYYVREVIAERLRLPGAGVTVDSGASAVDLQALRDEAAALRTRLDELVDSFADGVINRAQLERGTRRAQERLEAIAGLEATATGTSALAPLLAAVDPGAAFLEKGLEVQRAVIQALCTVTVLRGKSGPPLRDADGQPVLDPNTVRIDWK